MSRACLVVISLAAAAATQQQQYLPWEQQNVGAVPAWYAPKSAGFAAPAGSMPISSSFGSPSPYAAPPSYAARPSYPPNFPGYPTFGTVQPGGIPYSYSTTYKPRTTTGFRRKPEGSKSNLDKYLPLMKKKKAATTTTTRPSTTKRRKLPTRKTTVTRRPSTTTTVTRRPSTTTTVTRRPSTTTTVTKRPVTTVRPTTTTVADSDEWESVEIVEKTTTSTVRSTTERRKEEEKEKKLVKGPIVQKGRPATALPPTTTASTSSEEEEAEFNLLGFLWDKSELLASIKNMIKQLKSSIDEAGLEQDVKQVGDHLKNTIKTFASASPVNEQLGRLFERAQNADVKRD